ncbi:MAG: hypothetical protein M3Y37_10715, partial [Chloroflexota bacterium]|nr:hypothetical protein [Chloroflexota bacterium]
AINGEYVTSLGMPQTGPGGLAIGTGFDTEDALDDGNTPVTDFIVGELQVGLVASRQVRTVPFCYDDGMRTVRRTFCVTTRNRTCPAA